MHSILENDPVVLFQGDSVTDCGWDRRDDGNLGTGYPNMCASFFAALHPERDVKFINRAVSGNRVRDLQHRWETDCIEIKPDVVSILIGINDCWRRYDSNDPTSVEQFAASYRDILARTTEKLDADIILCEPFVLPFPKDRLSWRVDLDPKIHAVRELAREFGCLYIPLDGIFAQASALKHPSFWAADGVHPTQAGHALIANAWLKAVKAI